MSRSTSVIVLLLLGLSPAASFATTLSPVQTCEADVHDAGTRAGVPWLGVNVRPIDSELAATMSLSEPVGAFVAEIIPDSPAAASELEVGEVILSVKGHEVRDPADLARLVQQQNPGDTVLLRVAHGTDRLFRAVRLGTKPSAPRHGENSEPSSQRMRPPLAEGLPERRSPDPCPFMVNCGNGACCPQGTRCSGDQCISIERCPGMKYCGNDVCCPIGTQCCLSGGGLGQGSCCPAGTQCRADTRGGYYCWRP